jgi:thioesterase domain-containing protein/acyl carrier protein
LFAALLSGAALYPFHLRSQGAERLAEWLRRERITVFHSVPTVLRHLARVAKGKKAFPDVRLVRLGGEPVLRSDVGLFREHFSDECVFIQSFSSAETGIVSTFSLKKETVLASPRIPVGHPAPGVEIFLLDEQNRPLKNGGEGRIAVRSPRLKQGYWRQPELTDERFKSDGPSADSRLFLSNDIGRFLPDGSLEHLGRADLLVKIRGQRVDLGEVEAALMTTGLAREGVVLAHEDKPGEKRLIAFLVPNHGADVSPQNLRRLLSAHLPGYMVPAEFVTLEKLPQTPAGKVDRAALRLPTRRETKAVLGREHLPRDAMETRLLRIWESTLKIKPISRKDDFFELGGTSLQSVEVLLQIEELFGVSMPPSTLVEHSTIEKLSELLASQGAVPSGVLVKLREGGQGRPLFLIHSGQGDLASYGLLTRRLPGRPIFGLQSVGLHGESWPLTDMRAMAQRYLLEILKHDPTGPYLLAGTCMGGVIAFELAQMLTNQGKAVSFLGLMDTMFPLPKTFGKPWLSKGYISITTPLRERWQMLRWKTIRGLGLRQSDRRLRAYRRFIVRMNGRALRFYKPEFYSGKMTLFITTDTRFEHQDPRLMMEPLARVTEVVKIPGHRATLFMKPTVDKLAQQLQHAVESSEKVT